MKLPTHCHECGAYLMGGATEHKPDCLIQKMIEYARDGRVRNPICDFCSTPDPTWSFGCASFVWDVNGDQRTGSEDAWLACDACAAMIFNQAWERLAARNLELTSAGEMLIELAGKDEALRLVMELHAQFRKHATGKHDKIVSPMKAADKPEGPVR